MSSPTPDGRETPAGHASRLVTAVDTQQAGVGSVLDVVLSVPVLQFCLLVAVVGLWVAEGTPGVGERD